MARFAFTFAILLIAWLAFTFSAAKNELIIGVLASLAVAHISKKFAFGRRPGLEAAHVRFLGALKFAAYFIYAEIQSHLSVAKAVISGRVRPAILVLGTGAKSSAGKTLLSSAITLTPGTLSVDVGDDLYIHYLDSTGGQGTEKKFSRFSEKIFG